MNDFHSVTVCKYFQVAESQSEFNDENKQTPDFLLAKANYELPTRVHTVSI